MRGDRQVPLFFGFLFWFVIALLVFRAWYPHHRWQFNTKNIYSFTVRTVDGKKKNLSDYRGKTLLIVLSDSRGAMQRSYPALEEVYRQYKDRGLEVLAFPVRRFHDQVGPDAEWHQLARRRFRTTFPLFSALSAIDGKLDPFYWFLSRQSDIRGGTLLRQWPADRVLVSPDGQILAEYWPGVPLDFVSIEVALALPELWSNEEKRKQSFQEIRLRLCRGKNVPNLAFVPALPGGPEGTQK